MATKPFDHILVECDHCDMLHPQGFSGDCRNAKFRFLDADDYSERKNVRRDRVYVQPFLVPATS